MSNDQKTAAELLREVEDVTSIIHCGTVHDFKGYRECPDCRPRAEAVIAFVRSAPAAMGGTRDEVIEEEEYTFKDDGPGSWILLRPDGNDYAGTSDEQRAEFITNELNGLLRQIRALKSKPLAMTQPVGGMLDADVVEAAQKWCDDFDRAKGVGYSELTDSFARTILRLAMTQPGEGAR